MSRVDRGKLRLWIVLAGGIAVLLAVGWRIWADLQWPPDLIPGEPPPPALLQREKEVQRQVEAILAQPTALDRSPVHPITTVPSNSTPDLSAFLILEDHRIYDLREWKPVTAIDGPHTAGVLMTRQMKVKKKLPADRIEFLTRTSGADLVVRLVEPEPELARVSVSQDRPVRNGKEMIEKKLSADVEKIPVGTTFDLTFRTTYWNSLQTPQEQWFGTIGYDGSTVLSMLILFPESHPFKGGGLRNGPADQHERGLVPYTGTLLVFKGVEGRWMYWEVPGPKIGESYRLNWKW